MANDPLPLLSRNLTKEQGAKWTILNSLDVAIDRPARGRSLPDFLSTIEPLATGTFRTPSGRNLTEDKNITVGGGNDYLGWGKTSVLAPWHKRWMATGLALAGTRNHFRYNSLSQAP